MIFQTLSTLYAVTSGLVLWIAITVIYIYAKKINKWAIVDLFWSLSFVGVVFLGWGMIQGFQLNLHIIPVIMITLWGSRLAIHLGKRISHVKEDARYEKLKDGSSSSFTEYLKIFVIQAVFVWIMCTPLYFYFAADSTLISSAPNLIFLSLGTIICSIGLIFETVSDWQLKHLKEPGKLLDKGLWQYSRHPNYFGEILFWFGIWIMTRLWINEIPMKSTIINIVTFISPLLIYLIISKLTGPMLEKNMQKYEGWEEYSNRTPYIFPKINK